MSEAQTEIAPQERCARLIIQIDQAANIDLLLAGIKTYPVRPGILRKRDLPAWQKEEWQKLNKTLRIPRDILQTALTARLKRGRWYAKRGRVPPPLQGEQVEAPDVVWARLIDRRAALARLQIQGYEHKAGTLPIMLLDDIMILLHLNIRRVHELLTGEVEADLRRILYRRGALARSMKRCPEWATIKRGRPRRLVKKWWSLV